MLCLKAHAKINWTLDILGRRDDGYHIMDMLMQSVDMHDTLTIEQAEELTLEGTTHQLNAAHDTDELSSGVVTYDEKNLVYRAAKLLKDRYNVKTGARMLLEKCIPSGAGMGGGSADAAAALRGLNQLWNLQLSDKELLKIGLSLGADIPFMLTGGLARVGGIGEEITTLSPAPLLWLVMLQPCGGLSTKEVFTAFDALDPVNIRRPRTEDAQVALLSGDINRLGKAMDNVLEGVSIPVRPAIAQAANALEECGAVRGMMTGSGSVVYGIFEKEDDACRTCAEMQILSEKNGWGQVWVTHTISQAWG
ncbi:MAG: 4-(cytidine 5'-diphospho)-2-C-methyl-D-erythritol kinase [Clostridia bacterium]|nr:4-(cytidine 5'-diphospho)-2-C-methyl-D-erythritol kinase [Clostridia bacterium]